MMFPKPERTVDFELLAKVKQQGCDVCNRRPCDPCHIRSRGAGGPDTEWNVIPMCREHHTEQHKKGWRKFLEKYWALAWKLESLGWEVDKITGKMWHEGLAIDTETPTLRLGKDGLEPA